MLDKLVGAFTGGGGDLAANLVANRLTSKLIGNNSNKEALLGTLLMQGLGAENPLQNIFGAKADEKTEQMSAVRQAISGNSQNYSPGDPSSPANAISAAKQGIAAVNPISKFKQAEGTLGYADFLINAGVIEPDSKIANLLNSKVGEAIATSLATSLAAGLGDKMSSSGGGSNYAPRPFGGEGNIRLNIPNKYEQG